MLIGAIHPSYKPAIKYLKKPKTTSEFKLFGWRKNPNPQGYVEPDPETLISDAEL